MENQKGFIKYKVIEKQINKKTNQQQITNKKMKHYILIVLLILPFLSQGQEEYNPKIIRQSTKMAVIKIKRVNVLMSRGIYSYAMRPKQWDNFEKLKKVASKEELIKLTNHPNGVVRCYAFWALSDSESVNLLPIVLNHIRDEKFVNTQFGCVGDREMVGDFFINIASDKLDSAQKATLDSILIYSNSKLEAKSWAICDAKPTESLYPRIKEIYLKDNNQCALATLAKYRKTEDIPLILNNKDEKEYLHKYYYTYKAIQNFPHNDFFPLLEKKLYETLDETYNHSLYGLYDAIAAYKNKKAIDLLIIPFTKIQCENIRIHRLGFVYKAIRENKNEIYDSLLWKFWSEENMISSDIFQYLMEKDSVKVLEFTKENFVNAEETYSLVHHKLGLNLDSNLEPMKPIIPMMLDLILKNDYELGLETIRENIKKVSSLLISIFTSKAIEFKDKSFIEPLFERFAEEWNPHSYLRIAEALLSYQDEAINKRMLETRKINENLNKDWGGEALDKLLNEYE